jgi:hypothetical protein
MGFAAGLGRPLIAQADHALLDEATRFVGYGRTSETRLLAALGDPLAKQDDGASDLVIVLNRIGEQ